MSDQTFLLPHNKNDVIPLPNGYGTFTSSQNGQYFHDGTRKIDLVLAFEDTMPPQGNITTRIAAKYRETFQKKLKQLGLELENDGKIQSDQFIFYHHFFQ